MTDLADLKVPGPTTTPLSEPFWNAAAEGRLTIQRCRSCTGYVFYPRPICIQCWTDTLDWGDVSGSARLASFSEILKPSHPGWIPAAPYFVGLAQLDEGPRMLSHILTSGQSPQIGDRLQFAPTNIGRRTLPLFKLTDQKKD